MYNKLKLRWASKLLRSRYFVVLTDKESVIAMEGVDPNSFNDLIALQSQAAAIQDFRDRLAEMSVAHDKKIRELGGQKANVTKSPKKAPAKSRSVKPRTTTSRKK